MTLRSGSPVLVLGLLLTVSAPALAAARADAAASVQTAARLVVTVRDGYGVVPGAAVTLVAGSPSRPATRGIADGRGIATIDGLAPGTYDLRASFEGFADAEQRGLTLRAGEARELEIVLSLPQFSTQVTVTTANRREQLLLDVADPSVLLDEGQIADTGARTAKDLLVEQSGSGIQVQAGGGQGHLSINGIPNSGVLVLVDGRRYLGKDANGNFNLEDLPLAGVERVEVVKGAGSALYGSDALGGVINFITRRSKSPGLLNRFDLTSGSYGDVRAYDTIGWRRGRGGISGTAGYRRYDGFDLSEANPQTIGQPESVWHSADVSADYRIGDRVLFKLFGDYSRREIDNYFFSGATQLASTVYDSQRELTRYSLNPVVDVQAGPSTSLSLSYTRGTYLRDETRVFVVGGRVVPQAPWREWNDEAKLTGRHEFQAFGQSHALQGGVEYRREQLERATLSVANPERRIGVAWAQQEVGLGARVKVAAGLRFDDYSDFGSEVSPKASLTYAVAADHRLRASYGHGFRPPYFGELYLNTPPSFVGNPRLQPETADTVSAGYAFAGRRVQGSADYFRARVENGITFDLSRQPFTYGNLRTYTAEGTSLAGSVNLPGGFVPSLSYTFTRREDGSGAEIGGLPKHAAFVKLLWTNPRLGLRANLRGQILGAVPPGDDGSTQPGYQVWYTQVAKTVTRRGGHSISLYAQVANLFDRRDIFRRDAGGHPVPGDFIVWIAPRTFQAGLTIDLDFTR
jgi:outer membrane receptor for ferrienterochelin and colicins